MKEIRCPGTIKINNEWQKCNKRLMYFVFGNAQIMTKCPKCKKEFIIDLKDGFVIKEKIVA